MSGRGWPLVSVVFLAFDRRDALAASLGHVLERLDYPADRLEVIVVDNASTDGTAEMVRERFGQVQLIRSPENVGASAWNVGMATARGEWRMILDDDCHVTGDALRVAVEGAERHGADLVSFRVLSGVEPGHAFNDEYNPGLLTFWGCAAMFSRRAIENEPFYDPAIFIWANELELTMRLLDRGYRHLFLPEVEAVHMKGPSRYSERAVRLNSRHFAYIAAMRLRPHHAAHALVNLALHVLLTGRHDEASALRALPDVARGAWQGLRRRRPVRAEVSAVYRRNLWHFVNPIPLARSPLERLRHRDPVGAEAARRARSARWFARRRRLYPEQAAVLEL